MVLQKGIRINQYLDDLLGRARSLQTCLQLTQTLVALCQDLGWLVNIEKSKLHAQQDFDLVGYQFNLKEGKVRPTLDRWQTDSKNERIINRTELSSPATDVPHRALDSNRKTGSPRSTPYKARTVSPQEQLEGPRITGKCDTSSQVAEKKAMCSRVNHYTH